MKILTLIFVKIIRFYQMAISPLFPGSCRFHPTCSQYFIDALYKRGIFIGFYLGVIRILKCNPFFKGGFDPVPFNNDKKV
jgi:uncharacterized protein